MSVIVETKYPFIPGSHGIHPEFFRLPPLGLQSAEVEVIEGGSGARIQRIAHPHRLSFIGLGPFSSFSMGAILSGHTLRFGLCTYNNSLRHPDFFAGRFFGTMISIFEEVQTIEGNWGIGTDNLKAFARVLSTTFNPIQAAKETWTGRNAIKLGFTNVTMREFDLEQGVVVNFSRSNPSLRSPLQELKELLRL